MVVPLPLGFPAPVSRAHAHIPRAGGASETLMRTGLSQVMCVHLPAWPSPLLSIQPPNNLHTIDTIQAIWRAGGGCHSPCALLGCAAGWAAKWGAGRLLVKQQLWRRTVEKPQKDATFWDSVANTTPKSPVRGKTLDCLGRAAHRTALLLRPACGPCQAEARKQECSESKALFLFVCFSSSLLWQSLAQTWICISATTAEVVAKFIGTL